MIKTVRIIKKALGTFLSHLQTLTKSKVSKKVPDEGMYVRTEQDLGKRFPGSDRTLGNLIPKYCVVVV